MGNMIFVFGSNEAGIHGAGAARAAVVQHGAIMGQGIGRTGNAYGIPTKDRHIMPLPLDKVQGYVNDFVAYAAVNPDLLFQVTQIGCGLAGYSPKDIAPLFVGSPDNCQFDTAWAPWLGDTVKYWGTV